MGIINLEDIQTGMVLDADVTDHSGRVLLGAGSAITEKNLKIFRMWGITEADIRGVEKTEVHDSKAKELDQDMLREAEKAGRTLFRHADLDHPFMAELYRLFKLRMIQDESEGGINAL